MAALNRAYRAEKHPTDVLSFHYGDQRLDERLFLGEIVISPQVAFQNARRWKIAPEKEIRKLILHGILHLLGYDHETDEGEMNRLQARIMRSPAFKRSIPVIDARKHG